MSEGCASHKLAQTVENDDLDRDRLARDGLQRGRLGRTRHLVPEWDSLGLGMFERFGGGIRTIDVCREFRRSAARQLPAR